MRRFRRAYRIPRAAVLEVTVGDDAMLAALNRRWRGRAGPTDVLAFELGREPSEPAAVWLWGEVYVSLDRAAAQARERGVRRQHELETLVAHGLLHLVGFEHRSAAARAEMERAGAALVPSSGSGRGRKP